MIRVREARATAYQTLELAFWKNNKHNSNTERGRRRSNRIELKMILSFPFLMFSLCVSVSVSLSLPSSFWSDAPFGLGFIAKTPERINPRPWRESLGSIGFSGAGPSFLRAARRPMPELEKCMTRDFTQRSLNFGHWHIEFQD